MTTAHKLMFWDFDLGDAFAVLVEPEFVVVIGIVFPIQNTRIWEQAVLRFGRVLE